MRSGSTRSRWWVTLLGSPRSNSAPGQASPFTTFPQWSVRAHITGWTLCKRLRRVKLSRSLWIIPVGLGAAAIFRARKTHRQTATQLKPKVQVPWFIGFFLLASVARSFVPGMAGIAPALGHVATTGLTLTLFLIGAGLSAKTPRAVGWRPFLQGVLLWLFISVVSLAIIVRFV